MTSVEPPEPEGVDSARAGADDSRAPFDVALVPLLLGLGACFWVNPASVGTSAANALAALAIGALGALAFARDPFTADRYTRIGVGLLALLAIYYVALRPQALAPGGAMLEGARIATCALLIWASRSAMTRASSRWLALSGIGAAALFVSAPTVWDIVRDGAPTIRVAGELGYWNASAIVALTLVPLAAALARSPRRWMLPIAGGLVAVASGVAAATASRGALAATLLGLAVLVLASSDRRRWIGVAAVAAAGLLGGIALLAIVPEDGPAWLCLVATAAVTTGGFALFARRVGSVQQDVRAPRARRMSVFGAILCFAVVILGGVLALDYASDVLRPTQGPTSDVSRLAATDDSMRFEWWKESLRLWQDGRILGQGGSAFETSRAALLNDAAAHPHSQALQLLVEAGIIGLLIAFVAAGAILRATLGSPRSPERAAASAIAVMILAQAAIDWTLSLPQVMAVGALAIAILLPGRSRADHPVHDPLAPVTLRIAFGTLGVIAAATLVALVPAFAGLLADQAARDIDNGKLASGADRAHQSMQLLPTFSTLQLEVIALEASGQRNEARQQLSATERVWFPLPTGLRFAQRRFPEGSKQHAQITRRLEQIEAEQARQSGAQAPTAN